MAALSQPQASKPKKKEKEKKEKKKDKHKKKGGVLGLVDEIQDATPVAQLSKKTKPISSNNKEIVTKKKPRWVLDFFGANEGKKPFSVHLKLIFFILICLTHFLKCSDGTLLMFLLCL